MMLTVATWSMAKRTRATHRMPEVLFQHLADVLMDQEAPVCDHPPVYVSLHSPHARPDARIRARNDLSPSLVPESPLSVFERFAAVGTLVANEVEFMVASVHPIVVDTSVTDREGDRTSDHALVVITLDLLDPPAAQNGDSQ